MPPLMLHGDDHIEPNAMLKLCPGGRMVWRSSNPILSTTAFWPLCRADNERGTRSSRYVGAVTNSSAG
jgi:hypothetical protein